MIFDTHWFTTTEHVIAGAAHFSGLYTSDEMPRNICDLPYDYPGAPELAAAWHQVGKERQLHTVNVTTASLPQHYATINLVHHLRTRRKGALVAASCRPASLDYYLALGEALAEAVRRVDGGARRDPRQRRHEPRVLAARRDPRSLRLRPGARDLERGARDGRADPASSGSAAITRRCVELYPEYLAQAIIPRAASRTT